MKLRLAADLQPDSIIDGRGIRTVIWFQGCKHNCYGCQNPGTHDFDGGFEITLDEVFRKIDELKYQQGITLSGGDPFFQASAASEIAKYAHSKGLNVWAYTGFLYEALVNGDEEKQELLKNIDVLVDGPFMMDKKSLACKFRGSSNQRIIDVKKSLDVGSVVEYED